MHVIPYVEYVENVVCEVVQVGCGCHAVLSSAPTDGGTLDRPASVVASLRVMAARWFRDADEVQVQTRCCSGGDDANLLSAVPPTPIRKLALLEMLGSPIGPERQNREGAWEEPRRVGVIQV